MGVPFQVDVNVVTHAEQVDALEKRLNALQSKGVDLKVKIDGLDKLDTSKLNKQFNVASRELSKSFASKFKNIKIDNAQLFDYAKERKNVDALTKDAKKAIIQNVDGISKSKAGTFAKSYVNEQIKQNAQVERQLQRSAEKQAKAYESVQKRINSNEFEARNAKADKFLSKYDGQNSEVLEKARKTVSEIKSLQSELQSGVYSSGDKKGLKIVDSDQIKIMDQIDEKAKQMKNTFTVISNLESKTLGQGVAERGANSVATYMESNTKALKKYGEQLATLQQQYKSATTEFEKSDLDNQFKNLKSRISAEGLTGRSGWDEFKRAGRQIAQFAGIYGAIQNIGMQIPSQMIGAVKDVDSAMTNLYKVTDESQSRYSKYLDTASNNATELGRSMSSYISQTAEWSKLGYSLDESEKLSKLSSMYANVGEVSDATAVSDMVTAMKAFNIEASDASSIIDQLNILGNNFATSSADLGEGLSNSASSLATAGNDIQHSLAMLTGMAEITQSASESGNALKILSMRVRGYDEETNSYTNDTEELSGAIADLTKTAKTPGGISLFTDDTKQTYKDTYTLMEQISEIYDDLTDKNRAELLEKLAGKNRGNQIAALIQGFQSGQIQKAYQDTLNATGSAQQEQDRWLNSIEAKQEQFKAAVQKLSVDTISSDFFKGFVDTGTSVVNTIDNITSSIGLLNTAAIGLGIFQGKNNSGKSTWDSPHAFFKRLMPLESLAVMCTSLFISKDSLVTFLNGVGGNAPLSCYE